MENDHPEIELYITTEDDEQDKVVEQLFATLDLDALVKGTLQAAGIAEQVMFTLMIADDKTVQELNNQYRQQNKPTDVLSFPLLDKPLVHAPADQLWTSPEDEEGSEEVKETVGKEGEERSQQFVAPPQATINLGDIIISWPTVLKQSAEVGHSAAYELLYLIAHGVLHLVGYDDHSEAGYQAMVGIQEAVLAAAGQRAARS
jgi:probable rRNA maturation factor